MPSPRPGWALPCAGRSTAAGLGATRGARGQPGPGGQRGRQGTRGRDVTCPRGRPWKGASRPAGVGSRGAASLLQAAGLGGSQRAARAAPGSRNASSVGRSRVLAAYFPASRHCRKVMVKATGLGRGFAVGSLLSPAGNGFWPRPPVSPVALGTHPASTLHVLPACSCLLQEGKGAERPKPSTPGNSPHLLGQGWPPGAGCGCQRTEGRLCLTRALGCTSPATGITHAPPGSYFISTARPIKPVSLEKQGLCLMTALEPWCSGSQSTAGISGRAHGRCRSAPALPGARGEADIPQAQ